jgi:hypothetical protein
MRPVRARGHGGSIVRFMKTAAFLVAFVVSNANAAPVDTSEPHVAGRADLQAAIATRDADEAGQRATLQALLSRPEVRRLAERAGLDLERAQAKAALLEGDELARLASQARIADAQLAGGDALVIGSTTVIIILLIVILILVA